MPRHSAGTRSRFVKMTTKYRTVGFLQIFIPNGIGRKANCGKMRAAHWKIIVHTMRGIRENIMKKFYMLICAGLQKRLTREKGDGSSFYLEVPSLVVWNITRRAIFTRVEMQEIHFRISSLTPRYFTGWKLVTALGLIKHDSDEWEDQGR